MTWDTLPPDLGELIDGKTGGVISAASASGGAAEIALVARVTCPDLPVLPVEKRWARFAAPDSLSLLRGDRLVHTDLTAENFLVGDSVRVVDWAWPSVGAPWLDTATMVARLIQAGHDPAAAEAWADNIPVWRGAPREGLVLYARLRAAVAERNSAPIGAAWAAYLAWLAWLG